MKDKFECYSATSKSRASVPLSTLALFRRDASGKLVYHPPAKKAPQDRNPKIEERRQSRRFELRQDARAWTVTAQGKQDGREVRTCDVSRGGCALLVEQQVEPGLFLDLQFQTAEPVGDLPLAQVLESSPKGEVWFIRCRWLRPLRGNTVRCLLGRPRKKRKRRRKAAAAEGVQPNWLMRLWEMFFARRTTR
jgi:hypothetical protein